MKRDRHQPVKATQRKEAVEMISREDAQGVSHRGLSSIFYCQNSLSHVTDVESNRPDRVQRRQRGIPRDATRAEGAFRLCLALEGIAADGANRLLDDLEPLEASGTESLLFVKDHLAAKGTRAREKG
jgi:hypothetical protein